MEFLRILEEKMTAKLACTLSSLWRCSNLQMLLRRTVSARLYFLGWIVDEVSVKLELSQGMC